MKLFYFPFTHVPAQDRELLGFFFKQVFFISADPRQGWSPGTLPGSSRFHGNRPGETLRSGEHRESAMDTFLVLLPFPRELRDPVVRILLDHRQWAAHSGADPGQLKSLLRKTPYFTSDTQVSTIRSQIQGGSAPETSRQDDPTGALIRALVFLCLARENDEQNATIQAALSTVDEKKHRLFSILAGELSDSVPEDHGGAVCDDVASRMSRGEVMDHGALMTSSRLRSWFRVFLEVVPYDPGAEPFILVTTSPAVIAFFEEISPGGKLLLDKPLNCVHKESDVSDNVRKDQLLADMATAVSGAGQKDPKQVALDPERADSHGLELFLFNGDGIRAFFSSDGKELSSTLPHGWIEKGLFICLVGPGK